MYFVGFFFFRQCTSLQRMLTLPVTLCPFDVINAIEWTTIQWVFDDYSRLPQKTQSVIADNVACES